MIDEASSRRGDSPGIDVVVVMTGPTDVGISGGDVHGMRLCGRALRTGRRVLLAAPRSVEASLEPYARPALWALQTPFDGRLGNLVIYTVATAWRAAAVAFRAPDSRFVVGTSHFFHDVFPAAWLRRRGGGVMSVHVFHLVAESGRAVGVPSAMFVLLERCSLAALRRCADVVFVDNEETREALLRRAVPTERLVMTANAYDPIEAPAHGGSRADPPTLVFCGRLVDSKGPEDVLQVARALRDARREARIRVLGDGPLRAPLERAARAAGLDAVHFEGFVPESEKWNALASATVFLAPSREEGWGIAVGEALTAGTPAVVYDLPAYGHFGDLVDRVPRWDRAAWVRRVLELLDEAEGERRQRAIAAGAHALPRWDDVLDAELAALEKRARAASGRAPTRRSKSTSSRFEGSSTSMRSIE